jgi:hypothetical protein
VTIGTNLRNWSLAREELLPVAIQTRWMFGKLGHIGKRRIAFADGLPVFSGKLMTRVAGEFLFPDVSGMGKARVINPGTLRGLRASLAFGRCDEQSKNNYREGCYS